MRRLYDKEEQLRAAWRAGVDTPQTVFIRSADDLAEGAQQIPFPAIFKPVESLAFKSRFRRPVLTIESPEDLEKVYEQAADCGVLMLQEIVPGGDEELYTVGSALDARSRPLAVFTGRKIRQHPRTFGTARLAESVWIDELADAGLRLLRELEYHGVSQVEFKRDPRDGRFKLMEVNARHWLWHSLAPVCGVNLTLASYADTIGAPFVTPRQRDGDKWVLALKETVDSLREIRRGEQSVVPWVRSLVGISTDGVMALDDPRPGFVNTMTDGETRHRPGRGTPHGRPTRARGDRAVTGDEHDRGEGRALPDIPLLITAPDHLAAKARWVFETLLAAAGARPRFVEELRAGDMPAIAYGPEPVGGVPTIPLSAEAAELIGDRRAAGARLVPAADGGRSRDGGRVPGRRRRVRHPLRPRRLGLRPACLLGRADAPGARPARPVPVLGEPLRRQRGAAHRRAGRATRTRRGCATS